MLSQLRKLVQTGVEIGFFKKFNVVNDEKTIVCQSGPLMSNLLYYFREEWIKSFIRHSSGRYNFLWLNSFDKSFAQGTHLAIGWPKKIVRNEQTAPLILTDDQQSEDDGLAVRFVNPNEEMKIFHLADQRTRFWKKYFSRRERFECFSSKENQFQINYRFDNESAVYPLETIDLNEDSSFDLTLNLNQTLISLLIDAQMKNLHPLLCSHQIAIRNDDSTVELSFFLSKILTMKHRIRVLRSSADEPSATIPFHLILNEDSLKNGVSLVWSRETQMSEQIHVKHVTKRLADYLQALDNAL